MFLAAMCKTDNRIKKSLVGNERGYFRDAWEREWWPWGHGLGTPQLCSGTSEMIYLVC